MVTKMVTKMVINDIGINSDNANENVNHVDNDNGNGNDKCNDNINAQKWTNLDLQPPLLWDNQLHLMPEQLSNPQGAKYLVEPAASPLIDTAIHLNYQVQSLHV